MARIRCIRMVRQQKRTFRLFAVHGAFRQPWLHNQGCKVPRTKSRAKIAESSPESRHLEHIIWKMLTNVAILRKAMLAIFFRSSMDCVEKKARKFNG